MKRTGVFLALAMLAGGTAFAADNAGTGDAGTDEPGYVIEGAVCADGTLIEYRVNEAAGVARGMREGQIHTLLREVGSVPPRYVNEANTVAVTPTELIVEREDGSRLVCEREPRTPTAGTISGTVTKRDRMTLPAGTRVAVLLVGRDGEMASSELRTVGNQVPYHFLIRYDTNAVTAEDQYHVFARIEAPDGTTLYQSGESLPVLTGGQPGEAVELMVQPVATDGDTGSDMGGED